MSPPMTTQAGDTPSPICPEVEEDSQSASGGIRSNTCRVLGQPGSIQVSPSPILTILVSGRTFRSTGGPGSGPISADKCCVLLVFIVAV